MQFSNSWSDAERAASYAELRFPNTYYLAYRDLPAILANHCNGDRAVDFGCGTGRSSRFLKNLGYQVTGIDIAPDMLREASKADPGGSYILVENGKYEQLGAGIYDLVQAIFTFDNIPGWELRKEILLGLRSLLNPGGKLMLLDSTPELYVNEWASFSTLDFPENWYAKTGDIVRDIMLDVPDRRPVEDIFWKVDDYYKLFEMAGLEVEALYKPLGKPGEPFEWKSETSIAPWMIFILRPKTFI